MLSKKFRSRRLKAKLFSYIDCLLPRQKEKILFVVKDRTFYSGNLRVTLEAYIKHKKDHLYIYKDGPLSDKLKKELEEQGVTVLHGFTLHTIWHILTSGTVILSHNPRDAHLTKKCKNRKIINLWHGVAIKQIELLMPTIEKKKLHQLQNNSKLYDMVIASSEQDKITNARAFGVSPEKVKVTGLPRYEILKKEYVPGKVLQEEIASIQMVKKERKLVLFAPTFRENHISALHQFTDEEWEQLDMFARQNNILFGIRPHPYDVKELPEMIRDSTNFHLFVNTRYTEPNILLKYSDVLVVDFSSIWIDFLLLQRPIVGFSKDFQHYLKRERGFIYDFQSVFPGNFLETVPDLLAELRSQLNNAGPVIYQEALKKFHAHSLDYDFAEKIYQETEKIRNFGNE